MRHFAFDECSDIRLLMMDELEAISGGNGEDGDEELEEIVVTAKRYTPPPGYQVVPSAGGSYSVTYNGYEASVTGEISGGIASVATTGSQQDVSRTYEINLVPGAVINPQTGHVLPGTNNP